MKPILNSFGKSLVRHRYVYLVAILLCCVLSGWAIWDRLQKETPVDFTPQAIFMDQGTKMDRLREIEKTFGREDNDLVFILHGKGLTTQSGMDVIEELHEAIEQHPAVENVDSLYNVKYIENLDDVIIPEKCSSADLLKSLGQ